MPEKFNWFALPDGRMLKCDGRQIYFENVGNAPQWSIEAKTEVVMNLQWACSICRGQPSTPNDLLAKLHKTAASGAQDTADLFVRLRLAMYAWELCHNSDKLTVEGMPIVV